MNTTRLVTLLLLALAVGACKEPPAPATPADLASDDGGSPESAPATDQTPPVAESAEAYMERHDGAAGAQEPAVPEAVGAIVQCATCHGAEGQGNETLDAPRIGGLAEWYLARQLKYFKGGLRGQADDDVHGTQMRAIALPLRDAAIEDLAAYVADLEPPPAPALTTGDAERGERLYATCSACHGPEAVGNPALNTPSLVNQSGSYLVRQLENFRTGLRGDHPADTFGRQMLPIVQTTLKSREDAVDIVTYIASLRDGAGTGERDDSTPAGG